MNKEEIQKRVRLLRQEIETINTMISNFETQLDAEKPKLRRGDFGVTSGGSPYIRINDDIHWLSGITAISGLSPDDLLFTEGRLGNLVDLINNWGEK